MVAHLSDNQILMLRLQGSCALGTSSQMESALDLSVHGCGTSAQKIIKETPFQLHPDKKKGFEPRSGHMWDKPSSAFGCARWFFSGFSRFRPPTD